MSTQPLGAGGECAELGRPHGRQAKPAGTHGLAEDRLRVQKEAFVMRNHSSWNEGLQQVPHAPSPWIRPRASTDLGDPEY